MTVQTSSSEHTS